MTRVDFYLLSSADPQGRRLLACRLTEKAWRMGMKVFLRTADEAEGKLFDDLLWTFRQGSFIPHALSNAQPEQRQAVQVLVGPKAPEEPAPDLLINLAPDIPERLDGVARLAEIVNQEGEIRRLGRLRYRRYQDLGLPLDTHQLDASGAAAGAEAAKPMN